MANTYNGDLTTNLDIVRLTIGDTNSSSWILTDAEINYRIGLTSDTRLASIACVKDILAKIARDVAKSTTGPSSSRDQKTTHYRDLLKDLEAEAYQAAGGKAGGTSIAENNALEANSDFDQPAFKIGMDDYR